MPFSQLGLHPDLVRAVKAMNFTAPTPIHQAAIPAALKGQDVLGCAQTGGGKTAAFALPLLHHLLQDRDTSGIRAKRWNAVGLKPGRGGPTTVFRSTSPRSRSWRCATFA